MFDLALEKSFSLSLDHVDTNEPSPIYKDAISIGHENKYYSAFLNLRAPNVLLSDRWVRSAQRMPDSIYRQNDILLCGMGYRFRCGEYIVNSQGWPEYLNSTLNERFYRDDASEFIRTSTVVPIKEVFHVFHPHMRVYGHFLTEGVYKLALLEDLAARGVKIPLYLSETTPRFLLDFVKIVGPSLKIIWVESGHALKSNNVFDFGFHASYVWPQSSVRLIRQLAFKHRRSKSTRKLYISRKGLDSATAFRRLSNEEEVEALVSEFGFEVVNPAHLSAAEQVTLFSESSVIVGEYGSGMHNAIFSDIGTKVLCLNHINLVQQAIGRNFGHEVLFVMPSNGQPIVAPKDKCVQQDYSVDLDLLSKALEIL